MKDAYLLTPNWIAKEVACQFTNGHRYGWLPVKVIVRGGDGVCELKLGNGTLPPITIEITAVMLTWTIERFREHIQPFVIQSLGRDWKHHIRARVLSHQRIQPV